MPTIKTRVFPQNNYKATFLPSGKTLHSRINRSQPMTQLDYPEIYDIGINSKCFGHCPYCYIEATRGGTNFDNIVDKAQQFFGVMDSNQRPFQVAIGASGEPTIHPDFIPFLETLVELGIMPNYTTNGMHLSSSLLSATKALCGGVALTCHPHLKKHWQPGIDKLAKYGIRTNLHIIIQDLQSVDSFLEYHELYKGKAEYFVLLPYQAVGFAKEKEVAEAYTYLFSKLEGMDRAQVAYGAYFYDELKKRPQLRADIYEHNLISKYLHMEGNGSLHASSFEWETPLKTNLFV